MEGIFRPSVAHLHVLLTRIKITMVKNKELVNKGG